MAGDLCTAPRMISLSPLSLADTQNWRDTRGKWPLARNPDRSWWHHHTRLKLGNFIWKDLPETCVRYFKKSKTQLRREPHWSTRLQQLTCRFEKSFVLNWVWIHKFWTYRRERYPIDHLGRLSIIKAVIWVRVSTPYNLTESRVCPVVSPGARTTDTDHPDCVWRGN